MDLELVGPIGYRKYHLEKVCDEFVGHEHNYDHVTVVIQGRVKVLYSWDKDGKVVEGESKEYGPGEPICIKAKVRHTIKALEPNVIYMCIFSHRDFNGIVTQTYKYGNQAAYE